MDRGELGSPGELRAVGALLALAVVVTLAFAGPVLVAPTERIVGREIVGRHHDAYNYIGQLELPLGLRYDTQPVTDWPAGVVGALVGGVAGYNLVVLATFPLTALAAFLLARHLGLGRRAAGLASLVFAFSPFHVAQAAYHPHIVQLQWLPLHLLALWLAMDRFSAGRAALLVASSLALVLSNYYNFLIALCVTPVALLAYWIVGPRAAGRLRSRDPWLTLATLGSIALVGLAYVAALAPELLRGWGRWMADYEDLFVYSARWWSYLVPPVDHWLLGDVAERFWRDHPLAQGMVEHQLYVGAGLLALSGVAVAAWIRRRRETTALRAVPVLGAVAIAGFVSSLSPLLEIGAWEIPRPSALFYPVFSIFRAYARNGAVVLLMVALLAGIGLMTLLERRRGRPVALALLLVVGVEYSPFPPWRWHDVLPTTAHRWLAEQPGPMQILDCAKPSMGNLSVTDLMPHPTSVLGVFSRRAEHPERMRRFWVDAAMLDPVRPVSDCAEPGLVPKLAALGYTHLLVRSSYRLAERLPSEGLVALRAFEDAEVFTVEAAPARIYIGEIEGFFWRAAAGEGTVRWMGERGVLEVVNTEASTLRAELEIELSAFHREREVEVLLDGRSVGTLRVGTRPEDYALETMELLPGTGWLELRPRGEPLIPAEVLGRSDRRPLTIAVGHWELEVLDGESSAAADVARGVRRPTSHPGDIGR